MSILRLQRALRREAKRAEADLQAALEALAALHARRLTGPPRDDHEGALLRVSAALSRLSAAADLGGRLELRYGKKAAPPEEFGGIPDVVPVVAFEEAIRDLEERDPIGAVELQRLGLEVEDVYGGVRDPNTREVFYAHAFAAVRAIDAEVASKVKERLVRGLQAGLPTARVAENLIGDWDWPRSYAENVVRTTYTTATTAGRFREAERVVRAGIPVGFTFLAVMDSNTRPGHAAMNGLSARSDDPVWRSWSPPLGFQCRCTLSPLVGDDVPLGFVSVPHGAEKDPGFGGRPDLKTYR